MSFDFSRSRTGSACLSLWLLMTWMLLTLRAASALDLTPIAVGSATFQVEIARSVAERTRGLMFRDALPPDHGMLFVQPSGPAAFWMKNTYIPLDLLYFDAAGQLTQIIAAVPPCTTRICPIYSSHSGKIRYILEINAGEAARRGVQIGDRLEPRP